MDEVLKALFILNASGADIRLWKKIKGLSLPLRALFESDTEELKNYGLSDVSENILFKVKKYSNSNFAEREYEKCTKTGVDVITCENAEYPKSLFDLKDAPLLLYVKGKTKTLRNRAFGVVGTRHCSSYGASVAKHIGAVASRFNMAVVSGGAAGIDSSAHKGSCENGGVTIAVFGNGVDVTFPAANAELFSKICENGALLSEFPMGTKGEPWRFPKRNRLVAALSDRLVIAEAPEKSGAMITAKIALELGREVWAVPGRINEAVSEGTNRLIFDGAYPYISDDVFFGSYGGQSQLFSDKTIKSPYIDNLSKEETLVIDFLRTCGGQTVDNVAVATKMSAASVIKIVTVLSAKGLICSSGSGRYSAKV